MTITELVLENQKMKLDAQREAEHHDRMVGELEKVYIERDEARDALSKIDEIFCDGEDTHDDWMKMGNIAKDYLKGLE